MKNKLITFCHWSRLHKLFRPGYGGHTSILMLHRVLPHRTRGLPTDALVLTPEFLERFIRSRQVEGWRFISLDYLLAHFEECIGRRRNMVMTLDDGYRDNLEYAAPVFRQLNVPYTIYIANSFPNGTADLWWYTIIKLLELHRTIDAPCGNDRITLSFDRPKEALNTFKACYERLDRSGQQECMAELGARYPLPPDTARLWLTWDEIRELADDELCTIGCHTVNHLSLATLGREEARNEMFCSKRELEERIGRPVRHLAYPYGKKGDASVREVELASACGFSSAVTTRIGNVQPGHRGHLLQLPRIPLYEGGKNGMLTEIFLSGMYTAATNGFKRVVTD